jgi:hypothetical protein
MDTTHDVATRAPSILMIEGREYALYQGFLERIRLMDVKLLWLDAAKNLAILLYGVLILISVARPDSSSWVFVGALAAALSSAAGSYFMVSHSVAVVPTTVVEKDRQGPSATLYIFVRSMLAFSTRRDARFTATVHTDMADFLLSAFAEGQSRRFRRRPRVPSAFMTPRAHRQAWASSAGLLVAFLALVSIYVAVVNR